MFAIGIHHDGAPQRHISHVLHHLSYEYLRSGRNRSEIYSSAQEAVEEHFKDRWTAEQYATYLTISCVQLNRKLKECCNKTIIQLQHERMIKEIKKLLYDSEKSIKEIAYQLHFEDIAHFNRFFKTQTSITPAVFRRASKNEGVF